MQCRKRNLPINYQDYIKAKMEGYEELNHFFYGHFVDFSATKEWIRNNFDWLYSKNVIKIIKSNETLIELTVFGWVIVMPNTDDINDKIML